MRRISITHFRKEYGETLLSSLLAIYAFLIPFEEALVVSFGSIAKIVGILIIGYSAIVYRVYRVPRIICPLFVWLAASAISVLWAESFQWWRYFFIIYLSQFLFVIAVISVPSETINLGKVWNGLIVGATLAAMMIIFGRAGSEYTAEGRRALMLFGRKLDPNITGVLFMLGIYGILDKIWTKGKLKVGFFQIIEIILFVTGLLLTGSRGAFLTMLASIVFIAYMLVRDAGSIRTARILVGTAVALIALLWILLPENLLKSRFSFKNILGLNELRNGVHNRYTIWLYAFKAFLENPIFGCGCGNFYAVSERIYLQTAAHNLYILVLVENGVFLLGVFMFFLYSVFKRLLSFKNYVYIGIWFTICFMSLTLDSLPYKYFWFSMILCLVYLRQQEEIQCDVDEGTIIYGNDK